MKHLVLGLLLGVGLIFVDAARAGDLLAETAAPGAVAAAATGVASYLLDRGIRQS